MYEKNSKALNDEDLEKAAGGGFILDRGFMKNYYVYDEKGNKVDEIWFLKDAVKEAQKYGGDATMAKKTEIESLQKNGSVRIGNKIYYKDGSSRVVQ